MTPARLQTIEEIFRAALDQEPDEISAFLDTACEGDELLRRKIESLVASHHGAGNFIETSAVALATKIIENGQADLLVGQTIGHYKLSKRIGAGGMGEVYLATDITAGRKAALKLLPMRFTSDAERLRRFRQEARALVGLNHPNILTVYEIGEDHSTHYIASELIEGEALRQRLVRGQMQLREAVDVAIQIASALAAAHDSGIVHRDIKPENIMLRPDGYVKVLDFGIAKLAEQEVPMTISTDEALLLAETNLGSILGTVRYMSPEQACGAPIDQGTDVWSLGVVLYEMVTGHAPFAGETPREAMLSVLETEAPPLTSYISQIPDELQQIISKALRKDRTERYQNAHELLEALQSLRRRMEFKAELGRSTSVRSWLRWTAMTAALLGLAAIVAGIVMFSRNRVRSTLAAPKKSIAVMPFENRSEDKANAYFADGIQDEILTRLSKIADLKVISRASTQHYKSAPENLPEIARQLGVAHILEGSVQKRGEVVRVNVQLINAANDSHLWAETFDRKLSDIFSVESEVAQRIATALSTTLSGPEKEAITAKPTASVEAYQAYLKGRYFWNKRTGEGFKRAGEYFRQAIGIDPNYAPAYAGLSDVYQFDAFNAVTRTDLHAKARESAQKAVALDGTLAEPHTSLGLLAMNYDWDWPTAEKEFRRAIELNPNYATAHHWYAEYLIAVGRSDESLAEIKRARELDPLSLIINTDTGKVLYFARRYDDAIKQLRETLRMDPDFPQANIWLGSVCATTGLYEEAIAEFKKVSDNGWALGWLAYVYGVSGRRDEAEKILGELRQIETRQPIDPHLLVCVYIGLGNKDQAFAALEKDYELRSIGMTSLKVHPWYDSLRSDPRFADLLRRTNLGSTLAAPEKSIAVLPFENLSRDPDNAYFADGVQEEILTRLASVANLKVISRTSTQPYRSKPRNLAEIAKQLGVANILEGSVQKAADQVRVNVQLINAQTDSHLWADTYDRKLTDVFGVESDIAKRIAESLRAKLTGREEEALAVKPTNNPEAYDAYLRGLASEARSHAPSWFTSADLVWNAIGFYEQAVQLDPNFTLAWARLSRMNAFLYFNPVDPTTAARRDAAKRALENAQKLEPNSPETLLALGYNQYWVLRDYGLAKTTFGRVSKMLPGSSEVPRALGLISRREGHWDQSIAYFEQALVLDPRNVELLITTAETNGMLRQFATALKLYDRALDIAPSDPDVMAGKASIYQAQGNLRQAATLLSEINEQTPAEETFHIKITQLRLERNYSECVRLLQARQAQFHFNSQYEKALNPVWLAFMQRLAGDTAGAKITAEQAHNTLEPLYRDQPDNFIFAASLSQACAVMGEKQSGLEAAEQAIVLLPSAKDRVSGPSLEQNLAFIQTIFGENSRAISRLTQLLQTPYGSWLYDPVPITSALLRLDPIWDPLRADPRFQKLCEEKSH